MTEITAERLTKSPAEIGLYLGVSRSQVYRLMDAGEIPYIQVGHLRRVPTRAFLAKYGEALGLEPERDPLPAA